MEKLGFELQTKRKKRLGNLAKIIKGLAGVDGYVQEYYNNEERHRPGASIQDGPSKTIGRSYIAIEILDSKDYLRNDFRDHPFKFVGKKFSVQGASLTPDLVEKIREHYKDR